MQTSTCRRTDSCYPTRAIDEGEWNRAEAYLDELASLSPQSARLARLRKGAGFPQGAPEIPVWPPDGGAEPRRRATAGRLETAPTRTLVGPDRIEFSTRFKLVPPPGRPATHVEAPLGSERDGRTLGQPGATAAFAKAGIELLATALTLPVGTAPGRYTVEYRIETETVGTVLARSSR